ncbi:MAG: 30S ribosomal protein S9 [Mycoplasmataceae bacterium RC_NB112A]|nr:MAG: 30S ribosomal protein S9 [Mycoplasmataceae bacterium RC_NB112A]
MSSKNWISTANAKDKEATATVYLKEGNGEIWIEGKIGNDYFKGRLSLLQRVTKLFREVKQNYDLKVRVKGGGLKGKSDAIVGATAKAVVKIIPESRSILEAEGFLKIDPRRKESKKTGQPGARKKIQFSKR